MAVIDNWFIVTFHGKGKARFPTWKLQSQEHQLIAFKTVVDQTMNAFKATSTFNIIYIKKLKMQNLNLRFSDLEK